MKGCHCENTIQRPENYTSSTTKLVLKTQALDDLVEMLCFTPLKWSKINDFCIILFIWCHFCADTQWISSRWECHFTSCQICNSNHYRGVNYHQNLQIWCIHSMCTLIVQQNLLASGNVSKNLNIVLPSLIVEICIEAHISKNNRRSFKWRFHHIMSELTCWRLK